MLQKPYTKKQFEKMIRKSIVSQHRDVYEISIIWDWFKRDVTYPTGLKGSTGALTLQAEGYNPRKYILEASYYPDGRAHWTIL